MLCNSQFSLKLLLKVASLPRSTYYYELSKVDIDFTKNKSLCDEIVVIFNENKQRYGFRRIHMELLHRGFKVGHNKVLRLMKKMNLHALRPKIKYHSYKGDVGKKAPNIIERNFVATKPNEKWTTDVSQFNCPFGKVYLSPILDMYTSEIISWDLSLSPNLGQVNNMLNIAFNKYDNLEGLIFHSDQGRQYQHEHYQTRLKDKGIKQSMSRKGNCYDNSIMESFFGTLKNEMFYGFENTFNTFDQFYNAISEYINYYNYKRIQSKTKWMPPALYRIASIMIQKL